MASGIPQHLPPPVYTSKDAGHAEDQSYEKVVANAATLDLTEDSGLGDSELPTVAKTLVHLQLMHAIHSLRTEISNTDGLYGLYNADVTDTLSEMASARAGAATAHVLQLQLLQALKNKRWAVFVVAAARRFEAWWTALKRQYGGAKLLVKHMQDPNFYDLATPRSARVIVHKKDLPPLDVLMMWRAYMLNSRQFLEDCLRNGMMALWHTPLPWSAINASIDATTASYNPGEASEAAFRSLTGLSWTSLEDAAEVQFSCSNRSCKTALRAPLTTTSRSSIAECAAGLSLTAGIPKLPGSGWADETFLKQCHKCGEHVSHDRLQAARFMDDILPVIEGSSTKTKFTQLMPGTILHQGERLSLHLNPRKVMMKSLTESDDIRYLANEMLRSSFKKQKELKSMTDVRNIINSTKPKFGPSSFNPFAAVKGIQKRYFPRVCSAYEGIISPFSLDLSSAILSQGSFIAKMETIDWLHSPESPAIIAAVLQKYERFVSMRGDEKFQWYVLLSTLDIDLAFKTHKLDPASYYAYQMKVGNGRCVEVEDDIKRWIRDKAAARRQFAQTAKVYEMTFSESFTRCACLYCKGAIIANTIPFDDLQTQHGSGHAHTHAHQLGFGPGDWITNFLGIEGGNFNGADLGSGNFGGGDSWGGGGDSWGGGGDSWGGGGDSWGSGGDSWGSSGGDSGGGGGGGGDSGSSSGGGGGGGGGF